MGVATNEVSIYRERELTSCEEGRRQVGIADKGWDV